MTTIVPFQPVSKQQTSFGSYYSETKNKKHPNNAALSAIVPGAGNILSGQTGRGLVHMGIAAGTLVGMGLAGKKLAKTFLNPESITKAAKSTVGAVALGAASVLVYVGNAISSAFAANEGKNLNR